MSAVSTVLQLSCVVSLVLANCFKHVPCPGSSVDRDHSHEFGFDLSTSVNEKQFECFVYCGYSFVIIRAYKSANGGRIDANAAGSIVHAGSAGFGRIHVYMSPAVGEGAKTAEDQVNELVEALGGLEERFSHLWLVVKGTWSDSQSQNQQNFTDLLFHLQSNAAATLNVTLGVRTSEAEWNSIMGASFIGGSSLKLWYSGSDGSPSFDDFSPFGGWDLSDVKLMLYKQNANVCGANISEDWSS